MGKLITVLFGIITISVSFSSSSCTAVMNLFTVSTNESSESEEESLSIPDDGINELNSRLKVSVNDQNWDFYVSDLGAEEMIVVAFGEIGLSTTVHYGKPGESLVIPNSGFSKDSTFSISVEGTDGAVMIPTVFSRDLDPTLVFDQDSQE